MVIVIGANDGLNPIVRGAEGLADAAGIYSRNRRLTREQDRRDRLDEENRDNDAHARRLQDAANKRAQDASDREAKREPIEEGIANERLKGLKAQNEYDAQAQQIAAEQQQQAKDFAFDEWRQDQARQLKDMGLDVPDSFYEKDAQGHAPGEMGYHWSMYDVRSPVPIAIQQFAQKGLSEAAQLPPGASRAERIAATRRDAYTQARIHHGDTLLEEIGRSAQPQRDPNAKGAGQEEPDPSKWLPPEQMDELGQLIERGKQDPSGQLLMQAERTWRDAQENHRQEVAGAEARTLAVQDIDGYFQRMAEMEAQFPGMVTIDPMSWEKARQLRHGIAESTLHGDGLAAAKAKVIDTLRSKRESKQPSAMTYSQAAEAVDRSDQLGKRDPKERERLITEEMQRARRITEGVGGGAPFRGETPPAPGSPAAGGTPPPEPEKVQKAGEKAVQKAQAAQPQSALAGMDQSDIAEAKRILSEKGEAAAREFLASKRPATKDSAAFKKPKAGGK